MNLIYSKKANSFINLPNQVVANKSYNMLELRRETDEITSYEIEFNNYVLLPNSHVIERIDEAVIFNTSNIYRFKTR